MTTTLKPCPCGYAGALAGMNNGTHLSLSCPECSRDVQAWNAPPAETEQPSA